MNKEGPVNRRDVRLLLAGDQVIFRQGLKALLEGCDQFQIAGEAGDEQELVELTRENQPDLVLLIVNRQIKHTVHTIDKIVKEFPDIKIIAFIDTYQRNVLTELLDAGVYGFIPKNIGLNDLIEIINCVFSGGSTINAHSALPGLMILDSNEDSESPGTHDLLTEREAQVLRLLAEGATTKEIAYKLALSIKTIETHKNQLMKKLKLESIASLTKFAVREGLTDL